MTCWRCSGVISLHWRLDCSSVLLAIFSDGWAAYAVSCHFGTWHGHTSMSTNDSCSAADILGIMECTENDYCGLSCWDVCFHGISLTGIVLYGHLWLKVHVTGKLSCCNSSCIVNDLKWLTLMSFQAMTFFPPWSSKGDVRTTDIFFQWK